MKGKVIFRGPIYDSKKLVTYYQKSKVFCLTSKWESFGIVLVEAILFDNFILSTDVGGARKITDDFKYGKCISNVEDLSNSLNEIIEGDTNLDGFVIPQMHKNEFDYRANLKKINKKLFNENPIA